MSDGIGKFILNVTDRISVESSGNKLDWSGFISHRDKNTQKFQVDSCSENVSIIKKGKSEVFVGRNEAVKR